MSVSHEVSPLIKLVGRGDTTVVDAYLSPILRRYVRQVADELGADNQAADAAIRLMFMMSSGGLTAADLFQGKDALLSGPAAAWWARRRPARSPALTASSASTWAAPPPTCAISTGSWSGPFDTEVAGVRIRAHPLMQISQRWRPAAAPSCIMTVRASASVRTAPAPNPGPACYRRGGRSPSPTPM